MAKIRVLNYTFDASEKKITFTDYNPISLDGLLIITNATDNILIFNFADPTQTGTVATNVLTLTYDTSSMSDTDKLLIYYDEPTQTTPLNVTEGSAVAIKNALEIIDDWDSSDHCNIRHLNATDDVVVANLSATDNAVIDAIVSAVSPLIWLETTSVDVDATTGYMLYDCSAELNTTRYISITNGGIEDLFIKVGGANPVADGSSASYDFRLALGETRWLPIGYNAGTANDVIGIRAAAQTNDNVIVTQYGYSA